MDQNGNALARYTPTLNTDEPLAELRSGTTSYYSQDGSGFSHVDHHLGGSDR